jgi:hypothetical protein
MATPLLTTTQKCINSRCCKSYPFAVKQHNVWRDTMSTTGTCTIVLFFWYVINMTYIRSSSSNRTHVTLLPRLCCLTATHFRMSNILGSNQVCWLCTQVSSSDSQVHSQSLPINRLAASHLCYCSTHKKKARCTRTRPSHACASVYL